MKRLRLAASIISVAVLAVTVITVASAFGILSTASADNTATNKIHACLNCCAKKQNTCDATVNAQECSTEYDNCVATCNSDGTTPSDWGASCWGT